MPYKSKSDMQAAQRRWYENHRTLTILRSKNWKAKQRMLANEIPKEKMRRRAREYYERNRERIKARYHEQKKIMIEDAISQISPDYISPRMQALIKEFGEVDAKWYESIRLSVLKGISIRTLPEQEQERWWEYLKRRVNYTPLDRTEYQKQYHKKYRNCQNTHDPKWSVLVRP